MAGIKLDYAQMAEASSKLRTEEGNFSTAITNMERTINGLKDVWEGTTSQKYATQFSQLKPSFNDTKDLIEDLAKQLDAIVKTVKDTDTQMASKVGVKK